jgi:hypothetical protein
VFAAQAARAWLLVCARQRAAESSMPGVDVLSRRTVDLLAGAGAGAGGVRPSGMLIWGITGSSGRKSPGVVALLRDSVGVSSLGAGLMRDAGAAEAACAGPADCA